MSSIQYKGVQASKDKLELEFERKIDVEGCLELVSENTLTHLYNLCGFRISDSQRKYESQNDSSYYTISLIIDSSKKIHTIINGLMDIDEMTNDEKEQFEGLLYGFKYSELKILFELFTDKNYTAFKNCLNLFAYNEEQWYRKYITN